MSDSNIFRNLNEQQVAACKIVEGPLLILAGAGSGKTRTITYRIAYLISHGISPENILAVTFTNKAAEEMKERIYKIVGPVANKITMGTFHSTCSRILRKHAELIGYTKNFVIYDEKDTLNVIRKIIKEMDLPLESFAPKKIRRIISKYKREFIKPEMVAGGYNPNTLKIATVYSRYVKFLFRNNAMDFDDLIGKTVELMRKCPEIKEYYNEKFQFILVDEYQDTNRMQFELIKLLGDKYKNVCVVGDDDQSIYSFRGADIENILSFDKIFANTKIIKLEENYRSTKNILEAASNVIKNNVERKGKTLYTDWKEGEKIELIDGYSSMEEANLVMERIKSLVAKGTKAGDVAILYRINALSRVFEVAAQKYRIPYVVVGGTRFFERAEVKDILAYLKTIVNPRDNVSLMRVINTPPRGIGKKSMELLELEAAMKGVSLLKMLANLENIDMPSRAKEAFRNFYGIYGDIKKESEGKGVKEIMEIVLNKTAYIDKMYNTTSPEDMSKMENIDELLNSAEEFDSLTETPTLEEYLNQISLFTDIDAWKGKSDRINMMTVHGAKGLEFDTVFIVGAVDGLFPHINNIDSDSKIEEERRLFYVAMTRAKERLYISYSHVRDFRGSIMPSIVSRFVKEIPEKLMKEEKKLHVRTLNEFPTENVSNELAIHPVFGKIRILKIVGKGDGKRAYIALENGEKKWVLVKYAKLKFLEE
ncbi:MAG: UvrD-helicase domain-containing protein [Proteobacteria bacterium]|nr:UvrD-helicase domain-containing protein [Pseudomonadota bacterium]